MAGFVDVFYKTFQIPSAVDISRPLHLTSPCIKTKDLVFLRTFADPTSVSPAVDLEMNLTSSEIVAALAFVPRARWAAVPIPPSSRVAIKPPCVMPAEFK